MVYILSISDLEYSSIVCRAASTMKNIECGLLKYGNDCARVDCPNDLITIESDNFDVSYFPVSGTIYIINSVNNKHRHKELINDISKKISNMDCGNYSEMSIRTKFNDMTIPVLNIPLFGDLDNMVGSRIRKFNVGSNSAITYKKDMSTKFKWTLIFSFDYVDLENTAMYPAYSVDKWISHRSHIIIDLAGIYNTQEISMTPFYSVYNIRHIMELFDIPIYLYYDNTGSSNYWKLNISESISRTPNGNNEFLKWPSDLNNSNRDNITNKEQNEQYEIVLLCNIHALPICRKIEGKTKIKIVLVNFGNKYESY